MIHKSNQKKKGKEKEKRLDLYHLTREELQDVEAKMIELEKEKLREEIRQENQYELKHQDVFLGATNLSSLSIKQKSIDQSLNELKDNPRK